MHNTLLQLFIYYYNFFLFSENFVSPVIHKKHHFYKIIKNKINRHTFKGAFSFRF